MTRQKHSHPLKDPDLPARFARLLAKYIIKSRISDDQLVWKMNKIAGRGSGSLSSIRRHKDGSGVAPTYRMIGIYQEALGIPEDEIEILLDPHSNKTPGIPSFRDFNTQWQELLAELKRQSQLPNHIQRERALADAALKEKNYEKAREHLEAVREWTGDSYRDHETAFLYAAEEHAYALSSLGALAFVSLDFAEARVHYGKAIEITNLPHERLRRYRRSYLIASSADAARSKSEAEARAILKEMEDKGVTPNVVSYSSLLNFVDTEAEARAILKEMEDKGVTPDEITMTTAIKKATTFKDALDLIDFCLSRKFFVGRGAFEAAYSQSIVHLSASQLLQEFHGRKYKFDTALEGPINQYRKARLAEQALPLILYAPYVGAAKKLYQEDYPLCRSFFEAELKSGNDDDNVYYAFGIAAALNRDWGNAKPNLEVALKRAYENKRIKYIKSLLSEVP